MEGFPGVRISNRNSLEGFIAVGDFAPYNCVIMATIEYLDRMLDPFVECFTPEAARRVAAWRVDPRTQARVDELADRSTEGQLTPEDRDEYEAYVRAGTLISILQAKARALLSHQPEA